MAILQLLSACSKDGYKVDDNKVVYEIPWNTGHGTVIKKLNADISTFVILGDDNINWAKDESKVFWAYIHLKFMDSKSFEVLSVAFAKDVNYVICGEDIIKETNPKDFKLRTYIENGKEYIYGVDKNAAYLCDEETNGYIRILSNSIESFHHVGDDFFKDDMQVSWTGQVLTNVNLSTFEVLGELYATDGSNVYYTNNLIKDADAATFKVLEDERAEDKNYRYRYGRRK